MSKLEAWAHQVFDPFAPIAHHLMISDHAMNLITLWMLAVAFPIVGLGKIFLSQRMRRNTFIRTRMGDWLINMFLAVGFAFICIGCLSALTMIDIYHWWTVPLWGRWLLRISATVSGVLSLVATACVVRSVLVLERQYALERRP